ncbi:MAG: S8 family serine peptidase, partial [Bryobacteraceae bacterium]
MIRRTAALAVLCLSGSLDAATRLGEYALVLEDAPAAAQVTARSELQLSAASPARLRLRARQRAVAAQLLTRQVRISGTAEVLVNAIFVYATSQQAANLRSIPGVKRVEYLPPLKRHLDRAADLVRAPAAWNALGGVGSAGTGTRIGIIDSGIDNTHPAFQDSSLTIPAGFPKGRPEDLAYTNRKIIVARSYVSQLPLADLQAANSRPDDATPRDRVGHGTAVAMIAAGVRNTGPAATITGIAPKAYLGNYKVYGTPGVNDSTSTRVLIQALEDALSDGMDVVTLSSGSPAGYGPLARCPDSAGRDQACDLRADAVENASRAGMAVVVSAGNDGDAGIVFPSLSTIHSPGTAAAAITVGASTNAHIYFASVRVEGEGVPANLQRINALFGDGPRPGAPFAAPLRDVQQLQDDGFACSPLGNGSLAGAIALIKRGNCGFSIKTANAQRAGAVAVILYQIDNVNTLFNPANLRETGIPTLLIGSTSGVALKSFLAANPDRPVILDPSLQAVSSNFDTVADFTSRGPAIGDSSRGEASLKPELVAVGTDIYTATQRLDPSGELYDASGYTATQGTSFAVP